MTTNLDPNQQLQPNLPKEIGGFRVVERLGAGADGDVYKAFGKWRGEFVAIKVFKQPNADFLLQELQALSQLKHPNIPALHQIGQLPDGRPWFAVDFIDGETLANRLKRGRPSYKDTVRWIRDVAGALHHAHLNKFFHRDVKPANIMLAKSGRAFLVDFGIAIHEAAQANRKTDNSGSPPYKSPEQVRGETNYMDGRTDLWGLGAVLYELLTEKRPFSGTGKDLDDQILNREPKPPQQIDDDIPKELAEVALKCLRKPVAERYRSAKEVSDALASYQRAITRPGRSVNSFLRRLSLIAASLLVCGVAAAICWLHKEDPINGWLASIGLVDPNHKPGAPPVIVPDEKAEPSVPPRLPCSRSKLTETSLSSSAKSVARGIELVARFPDGLAIKSPDAFQRTLKTTNCSVDVMEHDVNSETIRWIKIRVVPTISGPFVLQIPEGLKTADGKCEYNDLKWEGKWNPPPLNLKLDRRGGMYCRDLNPQFRIVVDGELERIEELARVIRDTSPLSRLPIIRLSQVELPTKPSERIYDLIADVSGEDAEVEREVRIVVPVGAITTADGRKNNSEPIATVIVDNKPPRLHVLPLVPNRPVVPTDQIVHATFRFSEPVSINDLTAFQCQNADVTNWKPNRAGEFLTEISCELAALKTGTVALAIRPKFATDNAGNTLALTEQPIVIFETIPSLALVTGIAKEIEDFTQEGSVDAMIRRYEQLDEELKRIKLEIAPWQLQLLQGAVAFELARDGKLNKNMENRNLWLGRAQDAYSKTTKRFLPHWKSGSALNEDAFLGWILIARADELAAEFDDNEDTLENICMSLDALHDRHEFRSFSMRTRAMWSFVRWKGASYVISLRQKRDPKPSPAETKASVKAMLQYLIDSYQLYPTINGRVDLSHYVSKEVRPTIDPVQARAIDDLLNLPVAVTETSVFNHVSRLVDSYQRKLALLVEE